MPDSRPITKRLPPPGYRVALSPRAVAGRRFKCTFPDGDHMRVATHTEAIATCEGHRCGLAAALKLAKESAKCSAEPVLADLVRELEEILARRFAT